jgi:rhomboid protease GluP
MPTAAAPAVVVIVVINAIFFLLQQINPEITFKLASIPVAIADGQYYRLLTPMVLHANALHILFNSYVFWIYGPELERPLGTVRFVAVYVIAGFFGSTFSYAFGSCASLSVGASGAIFGVIGALLVYLYRRRGQASADYFFRGLIAFIILNMVISFVMPQIDKWAHIGGFLGGVAMGMVYDQHKKAKPDVAWQAISTLAVVAVGVAIVVWRTTTFSC